MNSPYGYRYTEDAAGYQPGDLALHLGRTRQRYGSRPWEDFPCVTSFRSSAPCNGTAIPESQDKEGHGLRLCLPSCDVDFADPDWRAAMAWRGSSLKRNLLIVLLV